METTAKKKVTEFVLSDGTKVVIKRGKAKHAGLAQRQAGDGGEYYIHALISILGTFNGKPWTLEEVQENIELSDYSKLVAHLTDENFI